MDLFSRRLAKEAKQSAEGSALRIKELIDNNALKVYEQEFIITSGQTVLTLDHPYQVNQNRIISLSVGGVIQGKSSYTQTSSTKITLSEAPPVGVMVVVNYFGESLVPPSDIQEQVNVQHGEVQTVKQELTDAKSQLGTVQSSLETVSAQLAEKANRDEVSLKADKTTVSALDTKINSQASGSPKGTYETLSALQTAFPTGNTNIYVVAADGKWYYWNGSSWTAGGTYQSTGIADKTIPQQKLTFNPARVEKSLNLFNYRTVTNGYYINGWNGTITADTNYAYSDYIPVYENTGYARTTATHVAFYDINKNYIGGDAKTNVTSPNGAVYARISLPKAALYTEQFQMGSTLTAEYHEYGDILKDIKEGSIPQKTLGQLFIKKNEIEGLQTSENLFNADTLNKGMTVSYAGLNAYAGYNASDYIPVKPSTKYTVKYAIGDFAIYYDENKNYLTTLKIGSTGLTNHTLTTPAGVVAFMRINITDTQLPDYMVVEGNSIPTEYKPYKNEIEWLTLKEKSIKVKHLENVLQSAINTKWQGKKFVTFGDSITHYDGRPYENTHIEYGQNAKGYQSYMREKLGCIIDNQGYNGAHIKLISSGRIKTYSSYANVDAVTITSGANDHRIGFAPGAVQSIGSTFNLDTYAGAFQDAIEYLLKQKPTLKIYLITPVKGWYTSETTTRYNGESIMSEVYINIMKEIAELYSLPLLDWYHESGINDLTKDVDGTPLYIGDNPAVWTAYQLHPTNAGYARMADILIPFLLNK